MLKISELGGINFELTFNAKNLEDGFAKLTRRIEQAFAKGEVPLVAWKRLAGTLTDQMARAYQVYIWSQPLKSSTIRRKMYDAENSIRKDRGKFTPKTATARFVEPYGMATGFLFERIIEKPNSLGSTGYKFATVKTTSPKLKNNAFDWGINFNAFVKEYPQYILGAGGPISSSVLKKKGLTISAKDASAIAKSLYKESLRPQLAKAFLK